MSVHVSCDRCGLPCEESRVDYAGKSFCCAYCAEEAEAEAEELAPQMGYCFSCGCSGLYGYSCSCGHDFQ